jgi:ADP-heptose:LPS heptosyltransferase
MASVLHTRRLGDTIHLHRVLKQTDLPFTVFKEFGFLFPDCDTGDHTTYPQVDTFRGPKPNEHIRESLASAYGVQRQAIGGPRWARPHHRGYLVLTPHGSSQNREWSPARWGYLRDALDRMCIPYRWCPNKGREPGALELEELVDVIKYAQGLISIDSGPIHVADGFGVPTLGLYGCTNPITFGPYQSRSKNIVTHHMFWPKGLPYGTHLFHPCHQKAMLSIQVNDVLKHIKSDGSFNL